MLCNGDKIECEIGGSRITGKVCGKVSEQPVIGGMYIIEPDVSIYSDIYPYTHFVMPEIQLTRKHNHLTSGVADTSCS